MLAACPTHPVPARWGACGFGRAVVPLGRVVPSWLAGVLGQEEPVDSNDGFQKRAVWGWGKQMHRVRPALPQTPAPSRLGDCWAKGAPPYPSPLMDQLCPKSPILLGAEHPPTPRGRTLLSYSHFPSCVSPCLPGMPSACRHVG